MKSPGKEVPGIMRLETHDIKQGVPQNREPDAKVVKNLFFLLYEMPANALCFPSRITKGMQYNPNQIFFLRSPRVINGETIIFYLNSPSVSSLSLCFLK